MRRDDMEKNDPRNMFSVRLFDWIAKVKRDKSRFIILLILTGIVLTYIASAVSQFSLYGFRRHVGGGHMETVSYNPFVTIPEMFSNGNGMYVIYAIGVFTMILLIIKMGLPTNRYDERGFNLSAKGTYGTSGWMPRDEVEEVFIIRDLDEVKGPIFGLIDDDEHVVTIRLKPEYKGDLRHYRFNNNVAVYGASGSGKSRTFVRNHIFQCARRNESMIVTDPKSEMYSSMAKFLEDEGYEVKVFNLVEPKFSDSWNAMAEIAEDPNQLELMAQTFTSVVIDNTTTENSRGDKFWDNAEMNLLKALCLYIVLDESRRIEDKNFGEAYRLLTETDQSSLERMFEVLPPGHPAKQPWTIFSKAGPTVKGNVITGLGTRLQVFQAKQIREITNDVDIDLTAPGKRKCAYFVIMSDQDSTLNFLSALFFSFIFIRLVRYADVYGDNGKVDVPVNFILDEFPNIGRIPDFEKKMATVRSRALNIAMVFQSLAQIENRYPMHVWEDILGNCDIQLFLGCTDQRTAEYVSKRTGTLTVEVQSTQTQRRSIAITDSIPSYRSTDSIGKRTLLEPDEVLRLDPDTCLLIARGCKVLKLKKFDYAKHPDAKKLQTVAMYDYIPHRKRFKSDENVSNVDGYTDPPKKSVYEQTRFVEDETIESMNQRTAEERRRRQRREQTVQNKQQGVPSPANAGKSVWTVDEDNI